MKTALFSIQVALGAALMLAGMPGAVLAQNPNAAPGSKSSDKVNTDITAARSANADKRFADAETLMKRWTVDQPGLPLPWLELGTAQAGLKKYDEAESSFKKVLGDATDQKAAGDSGAGFFGNTDDKKAVAPTALRASSPISSAPATSGTLRTPEVRGAALAGLGEVYALTGKTDDAEKAFDDAVKEFPQEAALYRRNEAVYFYQAGNSDAQLKAADQAIAIDPNRAMLYYFRGQALVGKATVDPNTQKLTMPPGCVQAFQKYLALDPNGMFAGDAKSILAAAGAPEKAK